MFHFYTPWKHQKTIGWKFYRAINDKIDSWWLKELNFPRPKDSENYDAP